MNSLAAIQTNAQFRPLTEWTRVCETSDICPDTGVCALVNGEQVAVFFLHRLNEYFAVSNFDPIGNANVLSRGMIGSIGDAIVVASPLYKQHFDLRSGSCLEKSEYSIATYPVRARDGWIEISVV